MQICANPGNGGIFKIIKPINMHIKYKLKSGAGNIAGPRIKKLEVKMEMEIGTPEMLARYLIEHHTAREIGKLLIGCSYARIPEVLDYYMQLKPTAEEAGNLLLYCNYARTPEMVELYTRLWIAYYGNI